ncbi:MAG: hypothetical protein R3E50_11250 [Halioglobus sp.]
MRMPVLLSLAERWRWLDNAHAIAPDDAIFRNEPEIDTAADAAVASGEQRPQQGPGGTRGGR